MSAPSEQFGKSELGVVRLYSVNRVVLFPHTSEALRVSDPDDLVLIDDALAGDRLVALAAQAPDWEPRRPHGQRLQPMACLARIAAWSDGGPGGYNVLFWGIARVRISRDLGVRNGVRQARVQLCEDCYPLDDVRRAALHQRLHRVLAATTRSLALARGLFAQIGEHVPLGVLCDMVAQSLELPWSEKEALLAECDVHQRAERLLRCLAALAETPGSLPARTRLSGDPRPN